MVIAIGGGQKIAITCLGNIIAETKPTDFETLQKVIALELL
jgi:hypothetical protein